MQPSADVKENDLRDEIEGLQLVDKVNVHERSVYESEEDWDIYEEYEENGRPIAPEYYDWREIYPELQILLDNFDDILQEAEQVSHWKEWPENHYREGGNQDWKVFPFLHCFPANDTSKLTWVPFTCELCPKTTTLLKQIPALRTALFSRLGPNTSLSTHTGWEDLANFVLRVHLGLKVPGHEKCGLWVEGKVEYHKTRHINVFDDSKRHKAFNETDEERLVLIIDLERPADIPPGTAKGGHTEELDLFISNAFC